MRISRMRFGLPTLLAGSTLLAAGVLAASLGFTPVPSANPKVPGLTSPNVFPPELTATIAARGSNVVENPVPHGVFPGGACPTLGSQGLTFPTPNTMLSIGFYGYDTTISSGAFVDGPMIPTPGDLPSSTHRVEATKTEPDENTFLELKNQHGQDPSYDYGDDFLFQGHEIGRGYISRINLEADGPHRVTILADHDSNGCPLPAIDGSVWNPFAWKLLLTSESTGNQSIVQASPDYPSTVDDLTSQMGHGGYEGVSVDDWGRIIIVEDIGGQAGTDGTTIPDPNLSKAKQPNSFVYMFAPFIRGDLKSGGIMYALQVTSLRTGTPIKFTQPASSSTHDKQLVANADIKSNDVLDLHTYGKVFDTKWVKIHDTSDSLTCPTGPTTCPSWNANTLAKNANATPFKRPENGRFRPGSDFKEFFFDETADTDATAVGSGGAGAAYGQFGALFKLQLMGSNTGKLKLFYNASDANHGAGFDNMAFWDTNHLAVVEDAGDGLHTQRNALDQTWLFNVNTDYSNLANQPNRLMAEGRDPSATIDSALSGMTGAQNEGDNEITGWITSNGDPSTWGLLGTKPFKAFEDGYRTFFTGQHGDNITWEVVRSEDPDKSHKHHKDYDDDDHDRDDRRW